MSSKEALEPPRTAGDMVRMARSFLERKGVEEWRLEAELLVAHSLALNRLQLFLQMDRPLVPREIDAARDLLVRRGRREPTAYITGSREFYGRPFLVGEGCLIPRSETEVLIDRVRAIARERCARNQPIRTAADLGTGSGCLALTIALEIPSAHVLAVDASSDALVWARRNQIALCVPSERVELAEGDGFRVLADHVARHGSFDLCVSNPPYIARRDRASLAPEVRDYEPDIALFVAGEDPDSWLERILGEGLGLLAAGGTWLVELGHDQGPRARTLAAKRGLEARFHKDLLGHERVLEFSSKV